MPTKEDFIEAARSGCQAALGALPLGPSNVQKFGLEVDPQTIELVKQSQASQKLMYTCFGGLSPTALMATRASIARATKAGNCGGMAAIAFNHVRIRQEDIRPMAYVTAQGNKGDDTHAFIAFNLPNEPHERIDNWKDDDVVICDPWIAWLSGNLPNAEATPLERSGVFAPSSHCDWVDGAGYLQKYTKVDVSLTE